MATKTENTVTKAETKVIKTEQEYWEEKIPYTIPYDRIDNSDVFVSVNGKSYQIQRGVEVMVPRNVVEVLKQSQAQDVATWRASQNAEMEFENEVKARGL